MPGILFSGGDMENFYRAVARGYRDGMRDAALEHHFWCLDGPLLSAEIYAGIYEEWENTETVQRIRHARSWLTDMQTESFFNRANYDRYAQSMGVFAATLGDFGFQVPAAIRECENAVMMVNAMFSPEAPDAATIERLKEYHRGLYPELFSLNSIARV